VFESRNISLKVISYFSLISVFKVVPPDPSEKPVEKGHITSTLRQISALETEFINDHKEVLQRNKVTQCPYNVVRMSLRVIKRFFR
jgi:hypothetical protein